MELVKKGRRTYGSFITLPSGAQFYLAYRRIGEIFRSGKTSISEAVQDDVACWAIDEETLGKCRARKVDMIGILVKDTSDIYMASRADFLDRTKAKMLNYETRGGALQRYLPLKYFSLRPGKLKAR